VAENADTAGIELKTKADHSIRPGIFRSSIRNHYGTNAKFRKAAIHC
jgi:hypothetical protein